MAEPSVDIIRRAQAGEPEALTQLILSQQHYVYSIAMSVLKNPEDAADLTQDAFVRLVRALPQYTGDLLSRQLDQFDRVFAGLLLVV